MITELTMSNPLRRTDTVASPLGGRPIKFDESGEAFPPKRADAPSNCLLAALPGSELLSIQPDLEVVRLARGSVLYEADEPLTRVYFVETGVVSLLTAFGNPVTVGMAMLGREGGIGVTSVLMGGNTALSRSRVLVSGSALAMEVPAFRSALHQSPKLRVACEAYSRALVVQMLQAVPCNRLHMVEHRYARWLLICADLIKDDTFQLRQEYLAEMLNVPPSRVTAIVRMLQQAGLIRYHRGAVTVLNRQGMEMATCECYRMVRDRYERRLPRACD